MPIYMDRHFAEDATSHTLELAHQKDLEIQDQYNVKFLTYWFDEERHTAFCLVEAPNEEAIINAHNEAHGGVPHEIMEVDPSIVETFLGRVKDPSPSLDTKSTVMDSAYRGIMFTDLQDSTLMTTIYGDSKALHLLHIHNALTRNAVRKYEGQEVKHTGDGFMVSFKSIPTMLDCAIEIQQSFALHNQSNPEEVLNIRIGLSAGEPIEEHGDLFGSSVQLAARLCSHANPDQINLSEEIFKQCSGNNYKFNKLDSITPKGFEKSISLYELDWNI